MQSLVSDVNSAVILYRQNALMASKEQHKDLAEFSIYGLNSLLPSELQLIFSDNSTVDEDTEKTVKAKCLNCGHFCKADEDTIFYDSLKYTHYFEPLVSEYLGRKATTMHITCTKCSKKITITDIDDLYESKKSSNEMKFFRKPPAIKNILDDIYLSGKFWDWFKEVFVELECRHRINREEVRTREGDGTFGEFE